jgi:hypothetical protein
VSAVPCFDPLPDWPMLRRSRWQRLRWTRLGCLFGAHRGCAGECACRCHHREIRDAWQARLEAELLPKPEGKEQR